MMGMNVKNKPDSIGSCTMKQGVLSCLCKERYFLGMTVMRNFLSLGMCAEKLCNNKTTRDCCTTLFMSRDLW